jgi:AcrR family transcriptional regulator
MNDSTSIFNEHLIQNVHQDLLFSHKASSMPETTPQRPISPPNASDASSTKDAKDASGGRRQERSEQRRERILEAARECLGEQGYAGATVTAIAQRAGVSNGLLYQFFRNKERLLEQVLADVVRDWVRAMLPGRQETAADALEGMFRRSVDFCRTHPLLPALLRQDPELQLSRISHAGRDRVQPHRDLVASLLVRGIEAGEFRADLDVASTADVICQLQSDYSGRACRSDERFPDDPRAVRPHS